jgi:predicted metalloprotease
VAAVAVVSLIAALAVPMLMQLPSRHGGSSTPSASPGGTPTARPTASPSPGSTPTAKPTATLPSDPLDLLKKNPVYALKVPAKCPYQSMPGSQAAFRKQVGKLVDCENAAWKKALAPTAVEFSKPKVKFYNSSVKSPCGKLGTNFPASYCTADSTLYFSGASYLQGRYFRLSVAGFVMHEYAHHVQKFTGIFGATGAMKESASAISRRIELQAHCMAHYELTVSGVGYGETDNRQIEYQWDFTNDPKGHGSTAAERFWGRRGLEGKSIGACNTWSAKASRVK